MDHRHYSSTTALLTADSLSAWSSSEGVSSGYDSDSLPETIPTFSTSYAAASSTGWRNYAFCDSDSDSDFESGGNSECSCHFFSESDNSDDETESRDLIQYRSCRSLCQSLRDALSNPHLCDLMFYVGPERNEMYGVKAVVASRSRVFFRLILEATKKMQLRTNEPKKRTSKGKKSKRKASVGDKICIDIPDVEEKIFRSILYFIHTGTTHVQASNVIGLLSASTQYDIPELTEVCRDFIARCTSSSSLVTIIQSARQYRDQPSTQYIIKKVYGRLDGMKIRQQMARNTHSKKVTTV